MILICVAILFVSAYPRLRDRGFVDYLRYRADPDSVTLPAADELARCSEAPFIMPTSGWVGVLFGDSIFGTSNHSGLDIFGLEGNGVTPVYAAYDGYVTPPAGMDQRGDHPPPGRSSSARSANLDLLHPYG